MHEFTAKMRVLVLGTGSVGMRHLRTLAAIDGVFPVAVPVRTERLAELRALGFAAEALDDALAGHPEGALVATDTGRHVADAGRCLETCPVLVEKPMAADADGARRLAERALACGRPLHVACCMRFDAGLRWLRARLPQLGRLSFVDAECLSHLPDWRPGRDFRAGYGARPGEGGVLLDLVHEIDYCAWLFGPVRRVSARLENRGVLGLPAAVEETASLWLEHDASVTTLRLSFAVRPPSRRLRVWGEGGALAWDGVARRAQRLDPAGVEIEATSWTGPDAMYRAQAEAWLATLRGGPVAPELADAAAGVAALAACDAARRSSARGGAAEAVS